MATCLSYTQGTDENFVAWEKYKENFQHLGRDSKEDPITAKDLYTKDEILENYNNILKQDVEWGMRKE